MTVCQIAARTGVPPAEGKWQILAIDGGGIRGLIPAKVLARLEELVTERDPDRALADCFDLIAGTSTGGLIALALTAPPRPGEPRLTPARLVETYSGPEGRAIF